YRCRGNSPVLRPVVRRLAPRPLRRPVPRLLHRPERLTQHRRSSALRPIRQTPGGRRFPYSIERLFMNDRVVLASVAGILPLALPSTRVVAADDAPAKSASARPAASRQTIARGRYMLVVGSCNDCHTAGFAPSDGHVPEKDWLLGGGPLGF